VVAPAPAVPALYEAEVTHVRRTPLRHAFGYRDSYWLVDFDDLPQPRGIAGWLGRLQRDDYLDVRRLLRQSGIDPARILVLSAGRTLGYSFNPLSVFWCYDDAGARCAVVAEVHNTYGERHAYVLRPDAAGWATVEKEMYVSPFNPAHGSYRIQVGEPSSSVLVSVTLERPGMAPFVASLRGTRRPITPWRVVRAVLGHSGARTRTLIQWQALRLWRRGLEVQPR
jgi:DUF1365 family protein